MSTAIHEASHAAAAVLMDRAVEFVEVHPGLALAGEELGRARVPLGVSIEANRVPLCLIGYMSEGEPGWPPPWPACLEEPREALGVVLRALGADQDRYEKSIQVTRQLLREPDFIRLRDAFARALSRVPRLEAEDIATLAAIHLEQQGALHETQTST